MSDHQMQLDVQQIRKVTWIGLVINVLLATVKFIVGFIGSSQAVIADAVHSLSDMATDFAVIFGVKFWSAPPDENHPYGHHRIEALVTTAIGLSLALVAVFLAYNAITNLRIKDPVQTGVIAVWGPILSIILKEWLYRWTIKVGRQVKSPAVIANAWHHRSDALSSMPALIAVVLSVINPEWAFVDHLGAFIISAFILKVSWDIIIPSLAELTDLGAVEEDRIMIEKVTQAVEGVEEVHAIRTRKFGGSLYVDLHMLVDKNITVMAGHDISEDVKTALLEKGPGILDVVIHIEPHE